MKTLILQRHSFAEKTDNKKDFDRLLTKKGIRVAELISKELKIITPTIDIIISSTAKRAMKTAKILKKTEFSTTPIRYEKELYYLQFSNLFFDLVYELDKSLKTVLFVGHNPIFTFLSQSLANDSNLFLYPCSFLLVNFQVEYWTEINTGTVQTTVFVDSKKIQEKTL